VLFDILGQHLAHPRVDGVQVWNTRWFEPAGGLADVLDPQNSLLPTGQALGLWGRHLQSRLLALPDQEAGPAYASYTPETQALTVFLMNKQLTVQSIAVELSNYAPRWRANGMVFAGLGPDDEHPTLTQHDSWEKAGSDLLLDLPPLSISIIEFIPQI
jgi:hypothetical protein